MYDNFKVANYSKAVLSPELFARPLSRLINGDVIDGFNVSPGTGLQVSIATGNALVRYGAAAVATARIVSLVSAFNLSIGTPDGSNPRIDLVVLYVDTTVNLPSGTPTAANLDGKGVAKAKIVPGTPAASPSAPNSTAIQSSVGSGNPYTILAEVRVDPGASVIAANKITDVRDLVSIANRGSSYVRAHRNTTQIVPNTTAVTVLFNSVATDDQSEYNSATGVFTAKRAKKVNVDTSIRYRESMGGINAMQIEHNETAIYEANEPNAAAYKPLSRSGGIKLAKGDRIRVRVYHDAGGNRTIDDNAASDFLSITEAA